MKAYSLDLREKILSVYESGNTSIRKVAERFQVNKSTVLALIKLKRETGSLQPTPATGGQASQLSGQEEQLREMVNLHPDYTLSEYCEVWEQQTGLRVSGSTMCRWLQSQKLTLKKNISQSASPV